MGSRQKKGCEKARLPKLTRRAVIAGTSATTFIGATLVQAEPPDDTARLCNRWLRLHEEIDEAQELWRQREAWLVANHRWFDLNEEEQLALPAASTFHDLDARIEQLYEERNDLAELLPARGGRTLTTIISKLAVVQQMIYPEDFPKAHALLKGSVQDLIVFSQANGSIGASK